MINDIWSHVFYFITQNKDIFNIATTNWNFHQLLERQLIHFPWYKFHKRIEEQFSIAQSDLYKGWLQSFVSPSFGAKFEIQQRNDFHYLIITDFAGTKRETYLRKGDGNDQYILNERIGYFTIEINLLNDPSFKFELNLDNEEFTDDDYPPRYQYKMRTSASLIDPGINLEHQRLLICGTSAFDRNGILILVKFQRPLHYLESNSVKVFLKHPNKSSQFPCTYHSLPLENHRFFIASMDNQIYVVFVKILNVETYEINCDIIYQGSHDDGELSQFILNVSHCVSHCTKILQIIKHKDHILKIIKEIPFDDCQ